MEDDKIRSVKSGNWLLEDIQKFENHYRNNIDLWEKALTWLKKTDLLNLPPGKYPIDNDKLFALVSEYSPRVKEEVRFEAHRKYIDIQHVVKGEELMGVAPLSKAKPTTPFDDQKDIGFFDLPEEDCKYYETGQGRYFVFFPDDAHRPGISTGERSEVKKVVVKLLV